VVEVAVVGWLDSEWLPVAGYLAVAAASLTAGRRARRRARRNPYVWPAFWYLTAALFLMMAVGRAGNVAELAANLGRQEAMSAGWYDHRRKYQALVIGLVAGGWFVAVGLTLGRVPERRRRYLPMAIVTLTMVGFAGIRTVSLHQVDGLLQRHTIDGVRVGAAVELMLLATAFALTFWHPFRRQPGTGPPARDRVSAQPTGRG
jgi:hypothetical protein